MPGSSSSASDLRHAYLSAIARQHAVNEADAEEALQETLANFLPRFDPAAGAPPLAWLTLALKRQCWCQRCEAHLDRRAQGDPERDREETGALVEAFPSSAPDTGQRVVDIQDARQRLGRLKADQRTALGQLGAGYSYKEIAARRGWTYTKVNRCISEGRAALQRGQRAM